MINTNRVATAILATAVTTATTVTTFAFLPAAQAADNPGDTFTARACVDADNVWVQVDFGSEKPSQGGCATEFTTGLVALESAGFDVDYIDSEYGAMLNGIEGVAPIWTAEHPVYWSYWTGEVAADYSVTYESYMVGASGSTPEAGTVESWMVSDGSVAPSLSQLPAAPEEDPSSGSSAEAGIFAVIAGVLALLGGGLLTLLTTPGILTGFLAGIMPPQL